MPPKKDKNKKKKMELSKTGEPAPKVCGRFLKSYEQHCQQDNCLISPSVKSALKQAIEDEKFLTKIVIEAQPINSVDDPKILLEPMLNAMRKERYNYIKAIYIWEISMSNQEMTALALLLEKSIYDIKALELLDNMIEPYGMRRLSMALPASPALLNLTLDYNEFGDEGCKYLCDGLYSNETMLSLSLNYCGLTAKSAACLGRIMATTAIRDVYLDGNDLGHSGAEQLLLPLVEKAETERQEKKEMEEAKAAAEEAARLAEEETKAKRFGRGPSPAPLPAKDENKPKKKKGKKKGKKAPSPPPAPGAWIHKLHLADNGIDSLDQGVDDFQYMRCIKVFARLIASSECLQELDLEDNLIGDMGGSELLESLTRRKEENALPKINMRTTHRMKADTLKGLIKIAGGSVKKKKGKGKKKKKK